jgi:hypothetical protein
MVIRVLNYLLAQEDVYLFSYFIKYFQSRKKQVSYSKRLYAK